MMNPARVQEGAVDAAEIDQPKLADILDMNDRVASRDFRGIENDRASGRSSD
jgi:hypothetical protein